MDISFEQFVTTYIIILYNLLLYIVDLILLYLRQNDWNKMKTKMKEIGMAQHPHNEHNMYLQKKWYCKNPSRSWNICSTLFVSIMKCEHKERGTHYGDAKDTMANMATIWSPSSSYLPQYPTLNFFLSYGTILNITSMLLVPFLATQYLT